jgi:hypothetical protein
LKHFVAIKALFFTTPHTVSTAVSTAQMRKWNVKNYEIYSEVAEQDL